MKIRKMLQQPLTNSILSSLKKQESYGDYKRTQQRVPNIFPHYIYYKYIVCAISK